MNQLNFWHNWHQQSRYFLFFLLTVFFGTLVYLAFSYFQYPGPAIDWELISSFDLIPVSFDEFKVGLFDFSYNVDQYVVSEVYRGSNIHFNAFAANFLLGIIALSFSIICTIVSTLKKFWFYFGALVVIGLLVSFRLEQLMLLGNTGKLALIVCLVLFLGLIYYFQTLAVDKGLFFRLASFLGLEIILTLVIHLFAEASNPSLVLLSYGIVAPFILSVIFIFMTAHVMISMFLVVATRNNTFQSKKSILHFSVLSIIYLLNLFLLFLKNTGRIDWDIVYLDAFLILGVTSILGFWEFRMREVQYQFIFHFSPIGAYFYLTIAIICLSTCCYFFGTANDPAVEALEDCIVYSQMGFGFIFFGYILVNFGQPLLDNKEVYKIMYKPHSFPYGTAQIVGVVATVAFFLNANLLAFNQAVAGYYNGLADLSWLNDDQFLAQQYYKIGDQYGYNNHRSNYALGALARQENDEVLTPFYFKEATSKNPTPYAYANLGNGLNDSRQVFDALFNLRKGLNTFPGDPHLQNNLALSYARTSVLDSALIYLEEARKDQETKNASQTNTLAVLARSSQQLNFSVDTLLSEIEVDDSYLQNKINQLILFSQQKDYNKHWPDENWQIPQDSVLSSLDFAYLYNYTINHRDNIDTTFVLDLKKLSDKAENAAFYEPLLLARAIALYQSNKVTEAFKILDNLQSANPFKTGYYNNLLGLWAMQQHAPSAASRFFAKAEESSFKDAAFRYAVSVTEANAFEQRTSASIQDAWMRLGSDTVKVSEGIGGVALEMVSLDQLEHLSSYWENRDDGFLYQLLRYQFANLTASQVDHTFQAIDEPNYRVLALHDILFYYSSEGIDQSWVKEQIVSLQKVNSEISPLGQNYLIWVEALLAEQAEDFKAIAGLLERLSDLSVWHQYKKHLYAAKIASMTDNDEVVATEASYLIENSFFAEGFLYAANQIYPDKRQESYYLAMLDAIQTNPRSSSLLMAYIEGSLANGLDHYAAESLNTLKSLLSPEAFQKYMQTYHQLQEKYQVVF